MLLIALSLACNGAEPFTTDSAKVADTPVDYTATVEPGPASVAPTFDDAVSTVHVTVHTTDENFATTDDPVSFCLSDEQCVTLDDPDWDDFGRNQLDVTAREALSWSRATAIQPSLRVGGSNAWKPDCVQARLDGEPVFCRQLADVSIDEDNAWTSADGLTSNCTTCEGSVLTHGPLLGAAEPTEVRLWYRTDATREVSVRLVQQGEDLSTAPSLATRWPRAEHDFTDTIVVSGLAPDTTWTWDLTIDGERFGPYTAKTPRALGTAGVTRVAFGSCTKADEQPIFEDVLAWQPDLFIFAGDAHYGNTANLNASRSWWRWAHGREFRRDMLATVPSVAVWDDHDFVDNNSDGTFPGIPTARRVVQEYTANTSYGAADEGIYSLHHLGDVDVFLVDARTWRNVDGFIGAAQRTWLQAELRASTAAVKLVVSGTQVTDKSLGESWAEQPADRDMLLSLADEIDGLVLLTGDIHRSEFRLDTTPSGGTVAEITSSPLATWNTPCGPDGDRIACLSADAFVGLEIQTNGEKPSITASMIDLEGTVRESWTFQP